MAAAGRRRSTKISTDERFKVSMDELKDLMEHRGADAVKQLHDLYSGVENLCELLGTSPTEGISKPSVSHIVVNNAVVATTVRLQFDGLSTPHQRSL